MIRSTAAVLIALLAACGDAGDEPAPGGGATTSPPAEGAGVRIEVSQGMAAGTHERSGETICVYGSGSWIAGFSEAGELEAQAVLEGLGTDGGTTEQLQMTAMFGDPMADENPGSMVMLAPGRSTELSGEMRLWGSSGEVRVQGTALDGQRISAVFRCSVVQR